MSITGFKNYYNLDTIDTGDILLFKSTIGKNSLPVILGTRSDWTHTGIAVWQDSPRQLMVFESNRNTGGVGLRSFESVMDKYELIYSRKINYVRGVGFETLLQNFILAYDGKPYTSPIHIPLIPFIPFTDPGLSCGELVARWLYALGLLTPVLKKKDFVNYIPSDYAPSSKDLETLFLSGPLKLVKHSSVMESPTLLWLSIVVIITTIIFIIMSFNNVVNS